MHNYVGNGWQRNGVVKISINLEKFKDVAKRMIAKGGKYATLYIAPSRKKRFGEDFVVYEWIPEDNQAYKPQQQQPYQKNYSSSQKSNYQQLKQGEAPFQNANLPDLGW